MVLPRLSHLAGERHGSTVTVSHSGSGVTQYALLQKTGATTYNSAGQIVSQIDGLNRVTAAAYDGDNLEQTGTYQGQISPLRPAARHVPKPAAGRGRARTYYVFGTTESPPSFTVSDNLDETVTKDTTAVSALADTLGSSDWYSWGYVYSPSATTTSTTR